MFCIKFKQIYNRHTIFCYCLITVSDDRFCEIQSLIPNSSKTLMSTSGLYTSNTEIIKPHKIRIMRDQRIIMRNVIILTY